MEAGNPSAPNLGVLDDRARQLVDFIISGGRTCVVGLQDGVFEYDVTGVNEELSFFLGHMMEHGLVEGVAEYIVSDDAPGCMSMAVVKEEVDLEVFEEVSEVGEVVDVLVSFAENGVPENGEVVLNHCGMDHRVLFSNMVLWMDVFNGMMKKLNISLSLFHGLPQPSDWIFFSLDSVSVGAGSVAGSETTSDLTSCARTVDTEDTSLVSDTSSAKPSVDPTSSAGSSELESTDASKGRADSSDEGSVDSDDFRSLFFPAAGMVDSSSPDDLVSSDTVSGAVAGVIISSGTSSMERFLTVFISHIWLLRTDLQAVLSRYIQTTGARVSSGDPGESNWKTVATGVVERFFPEVVGAIPFIGKATRGLAKLAFDMLQKKRARALLHSVVYAARHCEKAAPAYASAVRNVPLGDVLGGGPAGVKKFTDDLADACASHFLTKVFSVETFHQLSFYLGNLEDEVHRLNN